MKKDYDYLRVKHKVIIFFQIFDLLQATRCSGRTCTSANHILKDCNAAMHLNI